MSPPLCQDRSLLWNAAFGLARRMMGGFFFIGVRLFKFRPYSLKPASIGVSSSIERLKACQATACAIPGSRERRLRFAVALNAGVADGHPACVECGWAVETVPAFCTLADRNEYSLPERHQRTVHFPARNSIGLQVEQYVHVTKVLNQLECWSSHPGSGQLAPFGNITTLTNDNVINVSLLMTD